MKKLFILLLIPAMSGCSTARLETRLRKNSPNSPINEINGGIVSYKNHGSTSTRESRRKDAYSKMAEYCKGPYRILREGESHGPGLAMPVGNMYMYNDIRRIKIMFECVDKSPT